MPPIRPAQNTQIPMGGEVGSPPPLTPLKKVFVEKTAKVYLAGNSEDSDAGRDGTGYVKNAKYYKQVYTTHCANEAKLLL